MPKFDLKRHNPSPAHIRQIITSKGLSNAKAARLIGVATRTVDAWTSKNDSNARRPHYVWQFALESLENSQNANVSQRIPKKHNRPAP